MVKHRMYAILRALRTFDPFRRLEWLATYLICTVGAVALTHGAISDALKYGLSLPVAAREVQDSIIFFEGLAFLGTWFLVCAHATPQKGNVWLSLLFSLAMTGPVFIAGIYILYTFSRVH